MSHDSFYITMSFYPQATKILDELEDRMRAEIMQHLKLKEGELTPGKTWDDINLDEDYTSEVESRYVSLSVTDV